MKTYAEKLKDPRWQRKRLEILERDKFTCRHCQSNEKTLHVHHRIYQKGKAPWDYDDRVFVTLCDDCHSEAEEHREQVLLAMGESREADQCIRLLSLAFSDKPETAIWRIAAEHLADCIMHGFFARDAASGECEHHLGKLATSAFGAVSDIAETAEILREDLKK